MKVLFSPEYKGHVFLGLNEENIQLMDVMVCDTTGLIRMLELRLGIHVEEYSAHYRTVKYYEAMQEYMKKNPKNILADSFKLSSLGTAEQALHWRDNLVLDHWSTLKTDGMERLNVLAGSEKQFDCPGMADRLKNVVKAIVMLKSDKIDDGLKDIEVVLPCDMELLHPSVMDLLLTMQMQGAKLTVRAKEEKGNKNNLQRVAEMLLSTSEKKIELDENDDSLQIYQFYDENAANEYMAMKGDEIGADVWINTQNKALDNWLRMMGKSTMGSTMPASIPELLQLFVSGIDMMKEPLNIQSMISWLQSPMQPFVTYFGSMLADTIIRTGGYRNEKCQELVNDYLTGKNKFDFDKFLTEQLDEKALAKHHKKEAEERRVLVNTYLPPFEAREQEGLETTRLKSYLNSLATWAKSRSFLLRDKPANEGWCAQLESLAQMCSTFVMLLDAAGTGETVDMKQVDSWISTLYKGEQFMQYTAQKGSRMLIDSPAKMAAHSKRTVWMNFASGDARQLDCSFLYPTERKGMKDQLSIWDEQKEATYNELMQLMPFVMTGEQLILVTTTLTGGELTPIHPALVRIKQQVKNWEAFVKTPNLLDENMEPVAPVENSLDGNILTFNHAERIKWPDHLSPTVLSTLVEYPIDFLMQYLLGIVSTVPSSIAELKTTKGNVAHAVIESLFAPREGQRCCTADEIAKRIEEEFDQQVHRQIESCGAILYLPENKLDAALLKEQLKKCLNILLQILRDNHLVVTGCEHLVTKDMKLLPSNDDYDMKGYIDMTLEDENHHPVVFDFKWTTSKGTSKDGYYRKLLEDNRSIQLELYRYMLSAETRDDVERTAYFLMPEAHLYSKEKFEGIHCTKLDPANKDNIVEQLRQSFFYRKEKMDEGRVEIGEGKPIENLEYTNAQQQNDLFGLKSDKDGLQEENIFSNYKLFKIRKETVA